MSPAPVPRVLVIGAGPAGLAAATSLKDAGLAVTVLDAALRAGGKLGADADPGGVRRDHGLHIFPAWYANLRTLLARLGLAAQLVDHQQVAYVARGDFPDGVRTLRSPTGVRAALHNTFRGPMPWWESMLYQYFMLDLAGQPLRRKAFLDRISETGLLFSRWYRSEYVAEFIEANVLHAASVNASEISAMSWQRVLRYWLCSPSPFFSVLAQDLQTGIIDPWLAHLGAAGVKVETDRRVTRLRVGVNGKLTGVDWTSSTGAGGFLSADAYVLAAPLEGARALVDDDVFAAAPELGDLNRLSSEPMSGYHLQLDRKIPGLGADFLFLLGSTYALSLIDATPSAPTTTLSVVIGDFGPLRTLSDGLIDQLILDELRAYLPIPTAAIVRRYLHNNVSAPLFVNDVGGWPFRPTPRTRIANLYMAGDYCQNAIDLACTEGALYSGKHTAHAALEDLGYAGEQPLRPPENPRLLYRAAWAMGAPFVAVPVLYRRLFAPRS
jgi:glycine/D-amino acid oxidase-like deaminating enzyme